MPIVQILMWTDLGDLAIHCAILSKPEGERTIELLKYLIDAIPQSLEARSKAGWTPLLLAFSLNRFDAAKVLIEAGADQLKRDKLGRNLMHLVFVGVDDDIQRNAVNAKAVHALINKRVLQDLSVERCAEGPGALTPLGRWLYSLQKCDDKNPSAEREILKLLLECSNGADLVMMDGSGQLPLHVAVKMSYQEIVRFLVEENPALLYRENAMGQTPLELAETMWLQHHMKNPPNLESMWNNRQRPTRSFGFFPGDRNADEQNVVKTWLVCKEAAAKYSTKRTLVSLNDANEVSKRLAKKGKQIEVEGIYQDGDAKDLDFRDEVSEWYHHNDLASNKFGFRSWARRRRYRHSRVNY